MLKISKDGGEVKKFNLIDNLKKENLVKQILKEIFIKILCTK